MHFTTISNLANHLTAYVWTTSAMHAAVNFPQYAEASFPPFRPYKLRAPPPRTKADVPNEAAFCRMLPRATGQLLLSTTLNLLTDEAFNGTDLEQYLGSFPASRMHHGGVREAYLKFRKSLKLVNKKIDENNVRRAADGLPKYTHLQPLTEVPGSIQN